MEKIWFIDSNTGFTGGYPGKIFKTTDGGENWNLVYEQNTGGIMDIEFINESTGFAIYDYSKILKTTNGGMNWQLRNLGYDFTSIYFFNDSVGFLTPLNQYKLWKTTNTGVNWFEMNYTFAFISINDIQFINNNIGFVCGRSQAGAGSTYIGKTTNGGMNWTEWTLSSGYEFISLSFISSEVGFVSSLFGTLLKTTNGGQNFGWFIAGDFPTGGIIVQALDSNNVYVCGGNGFLSKSVNGGTNWSQMNSPTNKNLYDMHFINKDTGFACGDSGVVLRITNASTVSINNFSNVVASQYKLFQNYPNPFNPKTSINYELGITNYVSLKVYDALGSEVITLVNENKQAGYYQATFDGSNLPSGMYFYRLSVDGNVVDTKRMALVK
ncbi:MAG: YCF48-related protein [bacterium]|nr:YCF48-related protein [bacterium]